MEATRPVFNPTLYGRLNDVFGKVRVTRAAHGRAAVRARHDIPF